MSVWPETFKTNGLLMIPFVFYIFVLICVQILHNCEVPYVIVSLHVMPVIGMILYGARLLFDDRLSLVHIARRCEEYV